VPAARLGSRGPRPARPPYFNYIIPRQLRLTNHPPPGAQTPRRRDTSCEAWPIIRGQDHEPVVSPLLTEGDHLVFVSTATDGIIPTGGDLLPDTSTLPLPQAQHLLPKDSLPPAEQPLLKSETPAEAWPITGGQAPEPVVAPLFTDGGHYALVSAAMDGIIPRGCDYLPDTSTLPHPQPHQLRPLDSLPPAEQPPHSRDTPGEAWPNPAGQAPELVVTSLDFGCLAPLPPSTNAKSPIVSCRVPAIMSLMGLSYANQPFVATDAPTFTTSSVGGPPPT